MVSIWFEMTYYTVHYIYQNKVAQVVMSIIHLWIYFSLTDVDNAFSSTVFENLCFLHWLRESLFPLLTTRISVSFIDFQNLCFLYWLWESLFPSLTLSISVSFTDFRASLFPSLTSSISVSFTDFGNLFP